MSGLKLSLVSSIVNVEMRWVNGRMLVPSGFASLLYV